MRSLPAALAVIALMALGGCGGSSSKSTPAGTPTATTTATSTTPGKPDRLTQAQQDRIDRAVKRIISAIPLYQANLGTCVPTERGRTSCVRRVVRPAESAVSRSRKTIDALAESTGGGCSTLIQGLSDRLDTLTEDLRAETIAAQQGDIGTFTRIGAGVQRDLRVFASTSLEAQKSCA